MSFQGGTGVLRRGGCHRRCLEGETRPFAEYDPLCAHPIIGHFSTHGLAVCMLVAFHENNGNHENDTENSDSHKEGVECSRACAMTTKFLDNSNFTFTLLLSWRFPRKTAFWGNSLLHPPCPTPSKVQILFLLSSRRQPSECWISRNHGNHRNDENHGNPGIA